MRISGLGSGMDIDSMVKDLMKAQQIPYDKMGQKKTAVQWKKEDYATIYTSVSDFRNTVFTYKLQNTLAPHKATSSDDTMVSVSANGDAATINHTIDVTQLAQGATKTSSAAIDTTDMSSLNKQFGISGEFDIKINDKTVHVKDSESIYQLVTDINASGAGVKASFDTTLKRFMISTTSSGSQAKIDFSKTTGTGATFLDNNLKLASANVASGKDATFTLDSAAGLVQATNNFTISGITYNLKDVGTASISVASDVDKTVDNVKSFVESYNKLLAQVNGKLQEKRDRDYLPLTDTQKTDMKDADITSWQTKARQGLFQNDPILRDMVSNVRNNVADPVSGLSGNYTSAAAIGITTGYYGEGGKLYLDENKLRTALQADPDAVSKVFSTQGDTSAKSGLAMRMYDSLKTTMDRINTESGAASGAIDTKSNLSKRLQEYTEQLTTMNTKMQDLQTRYYNQFDAMDTALQKLSQQSNWLSQQLGTSK